MRASLSLEARAGARTHEKDATRGRGAWLLSELPAREHLLDEVVDDEGDGGGGGVFEQIERDALEEPEKAFLRDDARKGLHNTCSPTEFLPGGRGKKTDLFGKEVKHDTRAGVTRPFGRSGASCEARETRGLGENREIPIPIRPRVKTKGAGVGIYI